MVNNSNKKSPYDILGTWGSELADKKILLCVTGSISAYRSPDLARALIRHGAIVIPCMSQGAEKIIHPFTLHWATGIKPLREITAEMEHLTPLYEDIDLVLVAPATANIIGKIANGIADDVVSATLLTAMGMNKPIIIIPTMHEVMYESPILQENKKKLESLGIKFIEPIVMEGKAKIPDITEIVDHAIKAVYSKDMKDMKVLVTAGPTLEYIDPIRIITNKSSGKMGIEIARNAWYRGAKVYIVCGRCKIKPPMYIGEIIQVETTEEMYNATKELLKHDKIDIVIATAAAADLKPEKTSTEKIKTDSLRNGLTVKFSLTPKIIDMVKEVSPETMLVSFKAEYGLTEKELINRAYERLKTSNSDIIIVNDVSRKNIGFDSDENEVYIVNKNKEIIKVPRAKKREIAKIILDYITQMLGRSKNE